MTLLAWSLAWLLDFMIGDPQNWPHERGRSRENDRCL